MSSTLWTFVFSAALFANLITVAVVYVLWNLLGYRSGGGGTAREDKKKIRKDLAAHTAARAEEVLSGLKIFAAEARRNNFVSVGRPSVGELEDLLSEKASWTFDGAGEIKDALQNILRLTREWGQLVQRQQSVPTERAEIFVEALEKDLALLQQNLESVRRL